MFIAVLLTKAKLWKHSRCPTTDDEHTINFYSALKKKEIMLFAGKWMELESFMLSDVKPDSTQRLHVFPHMWKLDL
jgi:hypothetical protein